MKHMKSLKEKFNGTHVIINLVNQRGREHRLGSELARISMQAALNFVKYVPFDFHGECKGLDWSGLAVLRRMIDPDIKEFGFFASSVANPAESKSQKGYFRSNCMDCLDRTNVAQALIAKESLKYQLRHLGVINETCLDLDSFDEFSGVFRNRKPLIIFAHSFHQFSLGRQWRRMQYAIRRNRRTEGLFMKH